MGAALGPSGLGMLLSSIHKGQHFLERIGDGAPQGTVTVSKIFPEERWDTPWHLMGFIAPRNF